MINTDVVKDLAIETLQTPRVAAQKIMGLNLGRDVLWSSLILVACISSIIFSVSLMLSGASAEQPALLRSPAMFFLIVTGLQILTVHAFYWAGRALGGQGDLGEMLSLLIWIQALQAIASAALFLIMFISPQIEQLLSFAVGLLGFWITLNFITEALRLPSLWHAVGVVIVATLGIAVGIGILVSMIGFGALGVPANV